jgi:ribosomal protein S18 acetylase RimI-like enzyme
MNGTPRMPPKIDIRPVGEGDLETLLAVYRECEDFIALGPVATASAEMIRADLEQSKLHGGLFCGVFSAAGEMIGVADYVPGNFRGEPETACLALLMLKRGARGRGCGTRALEIIETEIRKDRRVRFLRAGVMVNNPAAIRFWKNRGFAVVSGPETRPDGTTVCRLEKNLEPARFQRASTPTGSAPE